MADNSIFPAVTNTQNPATSYIKPLRSSSLDSEGSSTTLTESDFDKPLQMEEGRSSFLQSLLSEEPEVESTPGGILQLIEHDEALLPDSKKTLVEQYEQIHDALLLGIEVIEDATKKLSEAFKVDEALNAIPREEDFKKEESGTEFCLFKEISHFEEALFPQVKEAVYGLKTNLYSKAAFTALDKIKAELETRKASIIKNLPVPQSKLFKLAHYLLDGLGTLITLILVAIAALGLATWSTTVPCALAALICLIVKAWTEKTAIPENNKNMYLKRLEEQYKSIINALKKMEDDVLIIEERQARQEMRQAIMQQAEANQKQAREAAEKQLEEQRLATQRILDAMSRPSVEKASPEVLITVLANQDPNSLTDEQVKALENWLHRRTPSPERILSSNEISSSSSKSTHSVVLTDQA